MLMIFVYPLTIPSEAIILRNAFQVLHQGGVLPLQLSCHHQDGLHCAHAKVVVVLHRLWSSCKVKSRRTPLSYRQTNIAMEKNP